MHCANGHFSFFQSNRQKFGPFNRMHLSTKHPIHMVLICVGECDHALDAYAASAFFSTFIIINMHVFSEMMRFICRNNLRCFIESRQYRFGVITSKCFKLFPVFIILLKKIFQHFFRCGLIVLNKIKHLPILLLVITVISILFIFIVYDASNFFSVYTYLRHKPINTNIIFWIHFMIVSSFISSCEKKKPYSKLLRREN